MISLQHISKIFNPGKPTEIVALKEISLQINKGEFLVVVGANGSGKSTLLNIIEGSQIPSTGKVEINGQDVTPLPEYKRSRWVARVFQNPNNGTASDLTILDNFRLAALRAHQKNLRIGITESFRKKVQEKIEVLGMGLENKIGMPMGNLSGGQRQALTLLMSAMDQLDILLLDEPTAALDPRSALVVMNLAQKLHQELGITTVLITHNLKDSQVYGNRLIQLREGRIAHDVNTENKSALSIQEIYKWFE
jgi:putative tryptophan/tyrosine transport system ATP-binding protein